MLLGRNLSQVCRIAVTKFHRCLISSNTDKYDRASSKSVLKISTVVNHVWTRNLCNSNDYNIWDDSNWMNHEDSNAEAYKTLDITKLRPFPEFRNVATGPVWPSDAFSLVWGKYYKEETPMKYAEKHQAEWEEYIDNKGLSPSEYFTSEDYIERYSDRLVWADFRRNHKGSRQKQRTRHWCYVEGKICGNPCPLCRDDNLLLNYKNLTLLNHFIDPLSGLIHLPLRTGVCRKKQQALVHTIWLARDQGLIPTPIPNHENVEVSDYRVDYFAVHPISK